MAKKKRGEGVQVENGYTKIADELLEALMGEYGHDFTSAEFKIMLLVIRYTYGFGRKFHKLSVSYVSKKTGLSNRYVKRTLNEMIRKKLLIVYSENTNTEARVLGLNKNYWEWQVPKRNTQGGELESTMGSREHQVNSEAPGELESTREGNSEAPQEGNCRAPIINNIDNTNINNSDIDQGKEALEQQEETQAKLENATDFIRYFAAKFREKLGIKYNVSWGRDGKIMKDLLEFYGPKFLKIMIDTYFEENDAWLKERGYTIPILRTKANELAVKLKGAVGNHSPDLKKATLTDTEKPFRSLHETQQQTKKKNVINPERVIELMKMRQKISSEKGVGYYEQAK